MKCDRCGCQFPAHEAETATINDAIQAPGKLPYTRIAAVTMCPECAAGRAATIRLVYWMVAAVVALFFASAISRCAGLWQ
jgi:hypothetical protein